MTACNSRPLRRVSLASTVTAIVAVVCTAAFCSGQPTSQRVIKRKLIIAQELNLDLNQA